MLLPGLQMRANSTGVYDILSTNSGGKKSEQSFALVVSGRTMYFPAAVLTTIFIFERLDTYKYKEKSLYLMTTNHCFS